MARSAFYLVGQNVERTPGSDHFWKLRCRKNACRCGANHISKSKVQENERFGPLLDVQMSLAWQAQGIPHLAKSEKNGFVEFPKRMARVGHLKRIWKNAFRVAGAVQETYRDGSSEMLGLLGGQGADFLRGVAFWSIRSVGLLR